MFAGGILATAVFDDGYLKMEDAKPLRGNTVGAFVVHPDR
jgi:hypothetical protein